MCRISIARDGSEDNLMFDYDSLLVTRKNRGSGQDEIRNGDEFDKDNDIDSEENISDYYNEESNDDYCNEKSDSGSDSEESVSDSDSEKEDIEVDFDINEYEEQEVPDYDNEFN